MSPALYYPLAVAVMSAVTIGLRVAPFAVLRRFADAPLTKYLAVMMPTGVLIVLVVYSLTSVDFLAYPYGIPALAGVSATVGVQHLRRNPLLSIVSGTAVYMVLLNIVL